MSKEFTGVYDKNGKKLYLGDKVEADNGVRGKVGSYIDTWSDDKPQKRYKVNWSPDGWINDHIGGKFSRDREEHIKKITDEIKGKFWNYK